MRKKKRLRFFNLHLSWISFQTETNEEPFDLDCAVRRQLAAEKAPLIDAQIGQTTKELGAPQAQTQAVR